MHSKRASEVESYWPKQNKNFTKKHFLQLWKELKTVYHFSRFCLYFPDFFQVWKIARQISSLFKELKNLYEPSYFVVEESVVGRIHVRRQRFWKLMQALTALIYCLSGAFPQVRLIIYCGSFSVWFDFFMISGIIISCHLGILFLSPEFFSGFFTQLHKLRSLRWSFLHFHFFYSRCPWKNTQLPS